MEPLSIKIGGVTYAIVFKEFEDKCGQLDRYENTIAIGSRLSKEQQQLTLWHEIFHAINGEMNEVMVEALAISIQQILQDNKLDIFKQDKERKCQNRKKQERKPLLKSRKSSKKKAK